jgi:hypothetical protein
MTNFFFMFHPGHGGGGWLQYICHNHPTAQMSFIGECHKYLEFERRGIPYPHPRAAYDREIYNFFESRLHYGDAAIGLVKSFRPQHVEWATDRVGAEHVRVCQMMRNPRFNFIGKWVAKSQRIPLAKLLGREPASEYDVFEATACYYVKTFYEKFLARAVQYPLVRLEDLNISVGSDGDYFQRFMEWLTGVEWPTSYVDHIRQHHTAAYKYDNWVVWDTWPDGRARVKSVNTVQRVEQQWPYRNNWGEDPEPTRRWARLDERQREIYLRIIGPYERQLGYNQAHVGSTDSEWAARATARW